MISLAAILTLLKRVPVIAWVIAFVVLSLAAAGAALYHHGRTVGEVHVHQIALQDSTRTSVARVDTAQAHSDTVVRVATTARAISDSTRADRAAVRAAALAELIDPGLPKLQHLVALDDALSRRDSVTIAVQAGAIDTLLAERGARERLDSLRLHALVLGVPAAASHRTRYVVGGIVLGAAAVLALVRFAR